MPSSNVEIVRRVLEAGYRRPKPDFATINELCDPDHELVSMLSHLDGRSFRGADGFREWLTTAGETWASYEWTVEDVSEIDQDRVLAVSVFRMRTRRGSVPMSRRLAAVHTVRDGKLVRSETYSSAEEALAAAGAGE